MLEKKFYPRRKGCGFKDKSLYKARIKTTAVKPPRQNHHRFTFSIVCDLGTAFFGSSAQNDAEWWSSCRRLIDFRRVFFDLKLAAWGGFNDFSFDRFGPGGREGI